MRTPMSAPMSKKSRPDPTMRNNAARLSLHASGDACPRCNTPCDTPSLLTSMTRYYVCARCSTRWQVARNWPIVQDRMADGHGMRVPATGDSTTRLQRR